MAVFIKLDNNKLLNLFLITLTHKILVNLVVTSPPPARCTGVTIETKIIICFKGMVSILTFRFEVFIFSFIVVHLGEGHLHTFNIPSHFSATT